MRDGAWLEPLRRELDAAARPCTFFFRDDDAGWETERLLALVDLFAAHAVPLDLAVIPAALDRELAARLRSRREHEPRLLDFHQHGFAHVDHEPDGRPCEFGPSRAPDDQRADIEAGARRLRALLGETAPIFTPPWNRCTEATGRCLLDAGFRVLVRDASAARLELDGLAELHVHVDWSARRRGRPLDRAEIGPLLAAACGEGTTGVMLHHALLDRDELADVARLLALLAGHENARCVPLGSLA
jgi:peptidoglycan/xylan/chitin deacetylase (PgdA/CDA1 family)